MRLSSFFKLVEIRTKFASLIPFALGTAYAVYHFKEFNVTNFFIMLISLSSIDMATTALNNYFDYRRSIKKQGYNYESHNAIVRDRLSETSVMTAILVLLAVAVLMGILLVILTNMTVLAIGAVSFGIGILYSSGPVPISRTPLGELFSGLFMGFVIVFLAVYIHVYNLDLVSITFTNNLLIISLNIIEAVYVFLLSIPTTNCIANIMLANNICDIEDDIENRRYTLPIYIGRENALHLFKGLYYAAYAVLVVLSVLQVIPWVSLLVLLTLIPVRRNIGSFYKKQSKEDTFVLSVKNFILICGTLVVLFGAALLLRML